MLRHFVVPGTQVSSILVWPHPQNYTLWLRWLFQLQPRSQGQEGVKEGGHVPNPLLVT